MAHGTHEIAGAFVCREAAFFEESLRTLVAVIYYLARFTEYVDVVGAEGEHSHARSLAFVTFHGVQYAGRIVHHPERVHHGTELVFGELSPHVVGETRTHEEHTLAGSDAERGVWYIYFRPEFHSFLRCRQVVTCR